MFVVSCIPPPCRYSKEDTCKKKKNGIWSIAESVALPFIVHVGSIVSCTETNGNDEGLSTFRPILKFFHVPVSDVFPSGRPPRLPLSSVLLYESSVSPAPGVPRRPRLSLDFLPDLLTLSPFIATISSHALAI